MRSRSRLRVCLARARIRGWHIETRLPARLRKWEEERTCTMHECVYIHTGPSWIYSRRNFATRGDERGMREEERKEFCGEMREFTDVTRVDCRRGCQGLHIFCQWNAYYIVTNIGKKFPDDASIIDSKILKKLAKKSSFMKM